MLRLKKKRSYFATRRQNFVPLNPTGNCESRLEPRSLAAPMIWRYSPSSPISATDQCWAWWDTPEPGVEDTYYAADENERITTATNPIDPADPTEASLSMISIATADADDLSNTDPPAATVGNFSVSLNTTAAVQINAIGPWAVNDFVTPSSAAARTYYLADSTTANAPATLEEDFRLHYNPPANNNPGLGVTVVLNAGIASPAAIIGIVGDENGINQLWINGEVMVNPSGTEIGPFGPIDYSWDETDVVVIATSDLILPVAARDTGIQWGVGTWATLRVGAGSNGGGADQTSVSTHYGAAYV